LPSTRQSCARLDEGHAGHVAEVGDDRGPVGPRRAAAQADDRAAEHHVVQRPERRAQRADPALQGIGRTGQHRRQGSGRGVLQAGAGQRRDAGQLASPGPHRPDEPLDGVDEDAGLDDGRQAEGGVAHVGGRLRGGGVVLGVDRTGARAGGGEPPVGPGREHLVDVHVHGDRAPAGEQVGGQLAGIDAADGQVGGRGHEGIGDVAVEHAGIGVGPCRRDLHQAQGPHDRRARSQGATGHAEHLDAATGVGAPGVVRVPGRLRASRGHGVTGSDRP
jgi:hypothetical protein